ncbi:MAG: ABC transporter ATP-binding protein [Actinomycetota bacterium]|nr:ABC transporter ATP-binding protein [Actinomycetota bacterium]
MQSESKDPAIVIENLSVTYRTMLEKRPTMKSALLRLGRSKQEVKHIEALKGLNLTIERGDFLGIIGHNGAGKSTLLRTIAGILPPSNGRISVYGDVTTLLSVGIGFNPELTGRENIRLGGLANGYSTKEIVNKEDEIAEFSELGEFIDYPMKTYSSGMYSRLGFSVVTHMDPDILLIDEALSAGDAAFRQKASDRIQLMMEKASAILLVSHGLKTISEMATKCLWLDHGQMMGLGDCGEIVEAYKESVGAGSAHIISEEI